MKVGVIGCGGMGTTHYLSLKALTAIMDLEVVALADSRQEFLEKAQACFPDARVYYNGIELIEKESLDMLHICLPSYLHAEHAIAAMEKKINVFVEKPLCLTNEDAFAVAEGVWDVSADVKFKAGFRAYFEEATVVFDGAEIPSLCVYKKDGDVEVSRLHMEYDVESNETGQETPVTLKRAIQDIEKTLGKGNVGINLDPANLIMYGKANPVDALEVFGEYVRGIHGKDGMYPTDGHYLGAEMPLGQGKVNYPAFIAKLKEVGYDGDITIEREITGEEQKKDIMMAKEILEKLI